MANVLGVLFQDIADAIRVRSGETGKIKPADFPDKIAAIETGGDGGGATITEFLPTTTATNQYLEMFGAFGMIVFIDEDTYNAWEENSEPVVVECDGQTYTCEVQDLNGVAAVGNLTMLGGTGNNEPFAISSGTATESDGNTAYFLLVGSVVDTEPTEHTIRIYQEAIPSFSFVEGKFTAQSSVQVVDHGCGEVPDIIIVYPTFIPEEKNIIFSSGFSNKMIQALGGGYLAPTVVLRSGGTLIFKNSTGIEGTSEDAEMFGAPRNATWKSFTIGGSTFTLKVGATYNFFCICGII